ncbi:TPA: hypothetical protein ACIRK1_001807 [Streptococcus suis]|nr:hypothetical protein [Streptococcus suis]
MNTQLTTYSIQRTDAFFMRSIFTQASGMISKYTTNPFADLTTDELRKLIDDG